MSLSGYSGTALAKKLGLKPGYKIKLYNEPDYYFDLFTELPPGIRERLDEEGKKDFIHYFALSSAQLNKDINKLRSEIEENGMIWISWYKKSAKANTDVTENIIREIALRNGLVDVKVCAVDELWSGLKFVIPVKERKK